MMNIKYALMMMLGVHLLAALSSVLVKQLGLEVPVYQLILYRQAFALMMLIPVLMALPGGLTFSPYYKSHFYRGLLITLGNVTFLIALMNLPLVTVTAVIYTSPIILVLISAHLLSEKLSKTKIVAVCAGFGGILMISRPSEMNIYIVMAFIGAITIALNSVFLKRIADKEHPMVTLFWSNVYSVVFIVPLVLWEGMPIEMSVVSTGFYLALLSIGITYLAIHALRRADASMLAPAEYSGLVFAAILGYWLFDDVIEVWTITGILVVIGSVVLPSKFKGRNKPQRYLKESN